MANNLPSIKVDRKTGDEAFRSKGQPLPIKLLSFWKWSSSDLVGNTLRGVLAEFIVASALGAVEGVRMEWDAYDIKTKGGIKVEVKSSAYIQSWSQQNLSTIRFSIKPAHGWDAESNMTSVDYERQSDVYVFCLLAHKDKGTIDPLNVDQWKFFVIGTEELNQRVGNQQTIGLATLKRAGAMDVAYEDIARAITKVVGKRGKKG